MRFRNAVFRVAVTAVAALFVLFAWHEWVGPDVWYHLYLGRRILETGSPQPSDNLVLRQPGFVNTYWLFQIALQSIFAAGGIYTVTLAFIALWAAALLVWFSSTQLARGGGWGLLFGLAAVLICQTRFDERPEVLSYLFLALQIRWLMEWKTDRAPQPRDYARFLIVQVLWSNMHGFFFLGPFLVGAKLVSVVIDRGRAGRPGPPARRAVAPYLALLLLLALLATLATPFGLGNWREVEVLSRFFRDMRFYVQEGLPPSQVPVHLWSLDVFAAWWWIALVAIALCAFTAARREAFAIILALAGLGLSAAAFRNVPLLVFFTAPLVAAFQDKLVKFRPPVLPTAFLVLGLALGLSVAVVTSAFYRPSGGVPRFGLRESRYSFPVQFSEYLHGHPFAGLIFNIPGDGGYLEYHFPDLHLYGDTRFVDPGLIRGYFAATANPVTFRTVQAMLKSDGVLLRVVESPRVAAACLADPDWALAYADLHRAFFVDRRTPAGAGFVSSPPHFYQGEDLSVPVNGASASVWIELFAQSGDRPRLMLALQQFSASPFAPPGALQAARQYAEAHSDPQIRGLADAWGAR